MSPKSLTAWRKRLGWSKTEAARQLGCGRNSLANWESGAQDVPLYIALAAAALAYGLRPIE